MHGSLDPEDNVMDDGIISKRKAIAVCNKDAFIIIKNQDRRDLTKSQPFPEGEFKPQHPYEKKK